MRVVDLFAGCGGLSLGFEQQGFNVVAAFELWDAAIKCYEANFTHPIFQVDLSDTQAAVQLIKEYRPDIIIGGPPCQDFSHAGKRVEAKRALLTDSYAEIISIIKPTCFVMENVARAQKSNAYASARAIFKKAGYGLTEIVLDASLCGTPQKRKRFFCFGMLGKEDGFALNSFTSRQAKKAMTLRDYFGESLGFEFYYRHPRNYNRRAVFSIDEPAPTMRGVNRPIPKGYKGHPGDPVPISEVSHALTTEDRAKIQTFPATYEWTGSKTDIEQMIGNAVPCGLAKFVGERIKDYFDSRERTELFQSSFRK